MGFSDKLLEETHYPRGGIIHEPEHIGFRQIFRETAHMLPAHSLHMSFPPSTIPQTSLHYICRQVNVAEAKNADFFEVH
jgi:hypothetical protein